MPDLTPNGRQKPTLYLTGTEGNVLMILGRAQLVLREQGWTSEEIHTFVAEAGASDRAHFLQTLVAYFTVELPFDDTDNVGTDHRD